MDYESFLSGGLFWGWKCLFRGEMVDEVILENTIHSGGCEIIRLRKTGKDVRRT
jgi:hypothetical protein